MIKMMITVKISRPIDFSFYYGFRRVDKQDLVIEIIALNSN